MVYEVKGRIVLNRPLRYQPPKKEPRERVADCGSLNPRLRPKDGFVQAIGFIAPQETDDE